MRIIALTGNVAAGKSTVAAELRRLGAHVIEADAIVRDLQQPGQAVLSELVEKFGDAILSIDGQLNRAKLRTIMLNNSAAKTDLETIMHPAVAERQGELIAQARARGEHLVVVDIPLLFEAGDPTAFDGIVLVDAPESLRQARLIKDRGMNPVEAAQLIASQIPPERKLNRVNWIVRNDDTHAALIRRVAEIWPELRA